MDSNTENCLPETDVIYGLTDAGNRSSNEDAIAIIPLQKAILVILADGMGGHAAGEVASAIAVSTVSVRIQENYSSGMAAEKVAELLASAFTDAHGAVISMAQDEKAGMGTTLIAAVIRDNEAIAINTGDSRLMLARNGVIVCESDDHTPVRTLFRMGEITEDEAMVHPYRHILSHAIGINLKTDSYRLSLEKGDILLFTSDGIHDYIKKDDILRHMRVFHAQDIVTGIMAQAMLQSEDNYSIIVYLHH
ncbi:MAG: serine/threonine-protein phosphatase [Methanospirillaceae archaeon]|nr:serine/threonine-protein phosphatase [Methanospirillaceae archaeon]